MMLRKKRTMQAKVVLSIFAGILAVVTLISREWIEVVFGVDPDGGSGTLEWGIVIGLLGAAASLGAWARADWTRLRAAHQQMA